MTRCSTSLKNALYLNISSVSLPFNSFFLHFFFLLFSINFRSNLNVLPAQHSSLPIWIGSWEKCSCLNSEKIVKMETESTSNMVEHTKATNNESTSVHRLNPLLFMGLYQWVCFGCHLESILYNPIIIKAFLLVCDMYFLAVEICQIVHCNLWNYAVRRMHKGWRSIWLDKRNISHFDKWHKKQKSP